MTLEAETTDPLVWGGSALEWGDHGRPVDEAFAPFRITVKLTNRAPADIGIPIYNPTFEMLQRENYRSLPILNMSSQCRFCCRENR